MAAVAHRAEWFFRRPCRTRAAWLFSLMLGLCAAAPSARGAEVGADCWPTWGGTAVRNMVNRAAKGLPTTWDAASSQNIKWTAALGRTSYGNPVLGGGRILVGTNNENPRNAEIEGDRGVMMCFRAEDGQFLWQDVRDKLPTGQSQDWPLQGICSSPAIDGDRAFYLTNRAELVCADLDGFYDAENDGPFQAEEAASQEAVDIVWRFDLIAELGVSPRFMASSNPLVVGDAVFVVTSNGVDSATGKLASPSSPSFIAVDKRTGRLRWQQGFEVTPPGGVPMAPVMEGQWGSPAFAVVAIGDGRRQPQVYFPGGDGFVYALDPLTGALIWKCNCNPPDARWTEGGRGNKNYLLATPVVAENRVFIATGQDPEHGGGPGNLLAIKVDGKGDVTKTGIAWQRGGKAFGRSISTVAVSEGVVYAVELDGFLHALDEATGEELWQHDMLSQVWGSPYVADGKVYLADEDGDVAVLTAGRELHLLAENHLPDAIYGTPIAVGRTLYLATRGTLFAIESGEKDGR